MFQRFFETVRRDRGQSKRANVTDALFAIADGLDNVSASIDELARRQGDSTDVGEALQSVADNLRDGLCDVAGQIGGA